jgi:hypothetical protein
MYVDITSGRSFIHKTLTEGNEILDRILENTLSVRLNPIRKSLHNEEALV